MRTTTTAQRVGTLLLGMALGLGLVASVGPVEAGGQGQAEDTIVGWFGARVQATPTDGQVLKYSATTGLWYADTDGAGLSSVLQNIDARYTVNEYGSTTVLLDPDDPATASFLISVEGDDTDLWVGPLQGQWDGLGVGIQGASEDVEVNVVGYSPDTGPAAGAFLSGGWSTDDDAGDAGVTGGYGGGGAGGGAHLVGGYGETGNGGDAWIQPGGSTSGTPGRWRVYDVNSNTVVNMPGDGSVIAFVCSLTVSEDLHGDRFTTTSTTLSDASIDFTEGGLQKLEADGAVTFTTTINSLPPSGTARGLTLVLTDADSSGPHSLTHPTAWDFQTAEPTELAAGGKITYTFLADGPTEAGIMVWASVRP